MLSVLFSPPGWCSTVILNNLHNLLIWSTSKSVNEFIATSDPTTKNKKFKSYRTTFNQLYDRSALHSKCTQNAFKAWGLDMQLVIVKVLIMHKIIVTGQDLFKNLRNEMRVIFSMIRLGKV